MSPTVTPLRHGVEVDLIDDRTSLSLRLCRQRDGRWSVILVDHLLGRPVLAELVEVG